MVVAGIALVFMLPALAVTCIGGRGDRINILGLSAHAIGGAAFIFYSVGLVEGHISSVILLFYLTPGLDHVDHRVCAALAGAATALFRDCNRLGRPVSAAGWHQPGAAPARAE